MRITLARTWTDGRGRTHKADKTLDVPDKDARALLHHGHARLPQPEPIAEPDPGTETTPATPAPTEEEEA